MTWQEVRDIFIAAGVERAAELTDFYKTVANSIGDLRDADTYELARQALTGQTNPVQVEAAANMWRDTARDGTRVTQMSTAELKKVAVVIAEGQQAGLNPLTIKNHLDMVTELDSVRAKQLLAYEQKLRDAGLYSPEKVQRRKEQLLRDRRETIARTEASYARGVARQQEAENRGARWKYWRTVGDDRVSEEICRPNEDAGWIDIDESFPSGDHEPPGHPNCRCHLVYATTEDTKDALTRQLPTGLR